MGWADHFRIFRRPAPPQPPAPDSTPPESVEDWAVGDQAECITRGWIDAGSGLPTGHGPIFGEVRVVRKVVRQTLHDRTPVLTFLQFDRWPGIYIASGFRKVRPRADETIRADAAFCRDWLRAPITTEAV